MKLYKINTKEKTIKPINPLSEKDNEHLNKYGILIDLHEFSKTKSYIIDIESNTTNEKAINLINQAKQKLREEKLYNIIS